jgi:hypothetical protein
LSAWHNQKEAIDSCDARALLVSGNIERKDISHFIMQYIVKTDGKLPFVEYSLDFVNKQVATKIQNKLSACSLEERRVAFIRNDKTRMFMKEACPKIYESVIADLLTWIDGVKWKTRVAQLTSSESSEGRKLVVFQVTRQTKNSKLFNWTAVNDFLQKICIPDARPLDRVRLILIPLPSNADTADMKPKQGSVLTPNAGTLKEYEVSKVPSSYDSMLD